MQQVMCRQFSSRAAHQAQQQWVRPSHQRCALKCNVKAAAVATSRDASILLQTSLRAAATTLAALALSLSPGTALANQMFPATSTSMDREEQMESEMAAELIEPRAVTDLLVMLDQARSSPEQISQAREKAGFRRNADGRVALRDDAGRWFAVKPDMQAPGYMLLREESQGYCFYLPADASGRLQQIDLSSDVVVAQLFGSNAWQDVMQPLQIDGDDRGLPAPLQLDEATFRGLLTLLDGAEDSPLAAGWAEANRNFGARTLASQ